MTIDPETGKPVAGQQLRRPVVGVAVRRHAGLPGSATCSGKVTTTTTAYDGKVATAAAPRTSTGSATLCGRHGWLPGAVHLDGDVRARVRRWRWPVSSRPPTPRGCPRGRRRRRWPVRCCSARARAPAPARSPRRSPRPTPPSRRSRAAPPARASCEGVTGGICQAVTNSGASTGPDANRIAPIMTGGPDEERHRHHRDHRRPAGRAASRARRVRTRPPRRRRPRPGSSANSGGPTVPGCVVVVDGRRHAGLRRCRDRLRGHRPLLRRRLRRPDERQRRQRCPRSPGGSLDHQRHLRDHAVRVPGPDQLHRGQRPGRCRHRRRAERATPPSRRRSRPTQARAAAEQAKQVAARPGATAEDIKKRHRTRRRPRPQRRRRRRRPPHWLRSR